MEHTPTIVVAVGRQLASGGGELGLRVAQRLGYAFIDREIVQQAAHHLGCRAEDLAHRDERTGGFWNRLSHVLSVGIPESVYTDFRRVPEIADEALFRVEAQVIRELVASRDAVLIGHAGFHVLRGVPGLVKIFIHASIPFRVGRMASVYNISDPAEAEATIQRTDQERDRFIRTMSGVTWTDARNYDLSIDMSRIPMEVAEEMVLSLVQRQRVALGMAQ